MTNFTIQNAIIESTRFDIERGLSAWLILDYGGSGQGFGGYQLYSPKSYTNHNFQWNYCGHFIYRCLEIASVDDWSKLPGKTFRVRSEDGLIKSIGHIIKDDWFNPSTDFKGRQEC